MVGGVPARLVTPGARQASEGGMRTSAVWMLTAVGVSAVFWAVIAFSMDRSRLNGFGTYAVSVWAIAAIAVGLLLAPTIRDPEYDGVLWGWAKFAALISVLSFLSVVAVSTH